mmetsp:Transcript_169729/g.544708  ORF Transcript_169729/g.544708 Transcript_169729/m.544708 type:complete len:280 (+) Transcript_169729:2740-3579(+)
MSAAMVRFVLVPCACNRMPRSSEIKAAGWLSSTVPAGTETPKEAATCSRLNSWCLDFMRAPTSTRDRSSDRTASRSSFRTASMRGRLARSSTASRRASSARCASVCSSTAATQAQGGRALPRYATTSSGRSIASMSSSPSQPLLVHNASKASASPRQARKACSPAPSLSTLRSQYITRSRPFRSPSSASKAAKRVFFTRMHQDFEVSSAPAKGTSLSKEGVTPPKKLQLRSPLDEPPMPASTRWAVRAPTAWPKSAGSSFADRIRCASSMQKDPSSDEP